MFFSILIPVYNVEKYICKCLDSVVNQTFKDYECILVDDGSTDNSGKVCDEYAKKYSFKVYHNKNAGLIATRRFALSKASGNYVVNLDSDDFLNENALQIIYDNIKEFNVDCVFYGLNRFSEDNKKYYPYAFKENKIYTDKREFYLDILINNENNSICRKAVKRELLGKIDFSNLYHISIGEDALQSLEIYKNCQSILTIKDCLYNYRMNNQSIMKSLDINKYDTDFTVNLEVLNYLVSEKVFNEKDFVIYRSYCVLNLVRFIRNIAESNGTSKQKKECFKKIKQSNYYKNFIKNGKIKKRLLKAQYLGYFLFKIKAYGTLIFLQKTFNKIKGN